MFLILWPKYNYTNYTISELELSSASVLYCPLEYVIEVQLLFVPILMVVVVGVVAVSKDFFAHISRTKKSSLLKACFHSLFGNFFRNIEKKIVLHMLYILHILL